jgi:type I restriction enzyme S subunit
MTPDVLIEYFERISEAPDAISRLRKFILDLAVRGKLVAQKAQCKPIGFRGPQPTTALAVSTETADPIAPAPIPPAWNWKDLVTLSQQITDGEHATPQRIHENQVPLVTAKNVRDGFMDYQTTDWVSHETAVKAWGRCYPKVGDILLVCVGATTGRLCVLREALDMVLVRSVALIRPQSTIDVDYLALALRSPLCQRQIWAKVKVSAQPCLYINRIKSLLIPVPPDEEQHRVVAKVAELMALCDQLEAARAEREVRRNRLVSAANHHLNNGDDPEVFRQQARFYFNILPRLTATSEHITRFRQTILNFAIRGQLVSQDPTESPASQLLERIQLEKLAMVDRGQLKKYELPQSPALSRFGVPLPAGWAPATLQQLCLSVTDGDHLPPPKTDNGVPFLVIGNVRSQVVEFADCRYVSEEYYKALDKIRRPKRGDILYTLVGSYGIPIIVLDNRPFCVQRHIGILRPSPLMNLKFLHRVLESEWVFRQATAVATGTAQKTVPLAGLRKILVPLPPLAEQDRIVARLDELMELCDKLETRITSDAEDTHRLLEAVLNEAIKPIRQKEEAELLAN